jgi:hypothetical protein
MKVSSNSQTPDFKLEALFAIYISRPYLSPYKSRYYIIDIEWKNKLSAVKEEKKVLI